jgi:hypothetical protein
MDGFFILTTGFAFATGLKSSSSLSSNPPFLAPGFDGAAIEGRGFLKALILGFLTLSESELSLSSES